MTAERDSMTLNEITFPALGVEERSDEAPRAGRARPTPDPEVVAKPKRRQFTAQYRLRILEEVDRCTQPGEVGRLLRREGLYSSHPDDLAQGAAQGLAAGVGLEEARRETGRTQPAGGEGALARGESGSPGARVAHRAHDPGRAGKSCRACLIKWFRPGRSGAPRAAVVGPLTGRPLGPTSSVVATVFPNVLNGYMSVKARMTSTGDRKA